MEAVPGLGTRCETPGTVEARLELLAAGVSFGVDNTNALWVGRRNADGKSRTEQDADSPLQAVAARNRSLVGIIAEASVDEKCILGMGSKKRATVLR